MPNNSASKRLAAGTAVYMIGNLMSKLLQMLILPIITAALVTSEYGYYDLIITTINLVTPIVTLQMIEGMFRFMFSDSEIEKKQTVSTVTFFLIAGCVALAAIIWTGSIVTDLVQYPMLIYLNYVSSIVLTYMQKLARCQQKNKQFAVSGVLQTIAMLATQAVTLIVLKMGVDGMLIANFVSYLVSAGYLMLYLHIGDLVSFRAVDRATFKKLFQYSVPLVPNSICWWLVSSSDRYIITFFIDAAANGVYAIAGKFAQLLTFVTSVFQLAWQESAILEANSEERDDFYSKTFNSYMTLLMGGFLVVLPFVKIAMPLLLTEDYRIGYLYNPILLVGAIFSAFSQFYGSAYLVFKKTSGAFSTTIFAAAVNIAIGLGLVKHIGLYAPALGTAISFGMQWLLRAHQMREFFKVTIDKKKLAVLLAAMTLSIIVYYMDSVVVQCISVAVGAILFLLLNKDLIVPIITRLLKMSRKE